LTDGEARFCAACGTRLEAQAHFCSTCGHVVGGADQQPSTPSDTRATGAVGPVVPAPTGPVAPGTAAAPGPDRRWLVVFAGVLGVIALVAVVGAVVIIGGRDATAEEVVLEPVGYVQADAFRSSVASTTETTPPATAVRVPPSGGAEGGQQVVGGQPGLYGGTANNATCDPAKLVAFLQSNPDKGRAWAGVLGITPAEIPTYVNALTPLILTRDTRVTNHGFANGTATSIPAVLQAGTAVMVDKFGIPRVKCGCGNPLTEPPPLTSRTQFNGPRWSGFATSTLVTVTTSVEVKTFVIVDVNTGGLLSRPPGAGAPTDTPLGEADLCKLFPSDPRCARPTTTTTSTTSSTTSTTATPPTAPPTSAVPTVPETYVLDRSSEATNWVMQAIARCSPDSMEYIETTSAQVSTERDTLYHVKVHIVLDSGDWWAAFEVDFATEVAPDIRPLDAASAPLVCS